MTTFNQPSFTDFLPDDGRFDIIARLPQEISTTIFRMLDPASVLSEIRVRRRWYYLYESNPGLRRILKSQIRERARLRHNHTVDRDSSHSQASGVDVNSRLSGPTPRAKKRKPAISRAQSAKPRREFSTIKCLRMWRCRRFGWQKHCSGLTTMSKSGILTINGEDTGGREWARYFQSKFP